ncbi:MAG: CHC2 zinc finger domain-containing protein [Bacteroidales bacterium]|nr:CHC2 zinc finger domain-containing protein [Bacteroidales bacterium]
MEIKDPNNPLVMQAVDNFDLFEFLDSEEVDYSTDTKNVGSGWVGISPCPSCSDTSYHFGLNIERKTGHCWVCGFTCSPIKFISLIKGISYKDAIQYVLDEANIGEEDLEYQILNILNYKEPEESKKVEKKIVLPDCTEITSKMIKHNPAIHNFFKARKLNKNHVTEYKLKIALSGWERGKLVIPIRYRKRTVAYQIRSFTNRFFKNEGPIKHYLYRMDRVKKNKRVLIVEGWTDYVITYDFLQKFNLTEYAVTTGFSKIITDEQISLLMKKNPKEVISLLDYDAWDQYHELTHRLHCDSSVLIPPRNKDPGGMTEWEFLKMFSMGMK